jgi:hypothetical protein
MAATAGMAVTVVANTDQDESDASLRATKMSRRLCEVPVNLWDVMEVETFRIRLEGMRYVSVTRGGR